MDLLRLHLGPGDFALIATKEREGSAEKQSVRVAVRADALLAVVLAADGVVDLAVGDLETQVGGRSRLVGARGSQIGPRVDRLAAQRLVLDRLGILSELAVDVQPVTASARAR